MRIHFWSSPRNISTALMYAFAQRPDTKVVDEPLYAHYLAHQPTSAIHPGKEEIMASMESDEATLVSQMTSKHYGKEIVVFKQMTHHLSSFTRTNKVAMLGLDPNFVRTVEEERRAGLTNVSRSKITGQTASFVERSDQGDEIHNVLLLRNPRKILASFAKVVDQVTAEDIGLPQQYELFQELKAAGKLTAILEARQLLLDPAGVLQELCGRLSIPYTDKMLSWPVGPIPEDGVWAKYWYGNVHKSAGFQPFVEQEVALSDALEAIAQVVMPLYEEMMADPSSVRSTTFRRRPRSTPEKTGFN